VRASARIAAVARIKPTLDGRVTLITGGSRGIGAATARELARRGAQPVLAATSRDALRRAAGEISPSPLTIELDVTSAEQCKEAVERTLAEHGRLDIVWANAGITSGGPLWMMSPEAWRRTIEVNLLGAYNTVCAALPAVIEQRGYVAVSASFASFVYGPGLSAYSATKAGVEAMFNSLRLEVAHLGVDVGTIHPAFIDTEMVRGTEASSASNRIRAALPEPFRRSYPVERAASDIATGFERRKRRICTPWFTWFLHLMRPVLTTRLLERTALAGGPDYERLFEQEIADRSIEVASLGERVAEQLEDGSGSLP
jgi:NAD(P)-dependent dehydrogenase (short-subunit alcohol dehydrogenase family)